MKFEDIKNGMHVRDHLGNKYTIVEVEGKRDSFPVRLCCTKLVQPVSVDTDIAFDAVGITWWIAGNRQYILDASDETVQQIMCGLGKACIGSRTIQVNTAAGESQDFYVYDEARLADFELTCDELEPIKVTVSPDSLKLGMQLERADGKYVVLGFDAQHVYLGSVVDATACDGITHKGAMCTRIPVDAPEGTLSLKDFKVVED